MIQEEIINRRLDGEKVSYIVQMGAHGKAKTVNLDKIDGEVFGTLDEVKESMEKELQARVAAFNENVDKLCEEASHLSQQWYGEQLQQLNGQSGDPTKIDPAAFIAEQNNAGYHQQQQMPQNQNNGQSPYYYQQPPQQTYQHPNAQMMGGYNNQGYMGPIMPMSPHPQHQQQALQETLRQRVQLPDDVGEILGNVEMPDGRVIPVRQGKPHQ